MLRYTEFGLSHREVPGEASICIYISGCPNCCEDCHYPELQDPANGLPLMEYIHDIIDLYLSQASCVCFMGEGDCSSGAREELLKYAVVAKEKGLKCCLYSGRDVSIENWMSAFDYLKTGSYQKSRGTLYDAGTNQRFFLKTDNGFQDITSMFWDGNDK